MIAVITSSLRPARGRRPLCRSSAAIWPLIIGTIRTVTPKSLRRKPQRHPPAAANRRSTTRCNARQITPARASAVKSP